MSLDARQSDSFHKPATPVDAESNAGDGYQLGPVVATPSDEPSARTKLPLSDDEKRRLQAKPDRVQFSVSEVLVTTTFIAIGMAGARWLPHGVFAAVSGVLALVCFTYLSTLEKVSRSMRLIGWILIVVYLAAAIMSLVHQ